MKVVLAAMGMCSALVLAAAQESLPDGEGKAVVETFCARRCHGAAELQKTRRTPPQWEIVVEQMIERGAVVPDEDFDAIVAYLGRHFFATVPINSAPARLIVEVLEITLDQAAAIVSVREKHGPFKTWEQVAAAAGIELKEMEPKKDRLAF